MLLTHLLRRGEDAAALPAARSSLFQNPAHERWQMGNTPRHKPGSAPDHLSAGVFPVSFFAEALSALGAGELSDLGAAALADLAAVSALTSEW